MPSSVAELLKAGGLKPGGAVKWGQVDLLDGPGIYLIALVEDPASSAGGIQSAPISLRSIRDLVARATDLKLDGQPCHNPRDIADRLSGMWLPDEVVVYIGKASTSVRQRVRQYYSTPLGNRSPHAGGWALKTLTVLPDLWVHWAPSDRPELVEQQALAEFADRTSQQSRRSLVDPAHPFPFANLEGPGGRKQHGIGGARSAKGRAAASTKPRSLAKESVLTQSPRGLSLVPGRKVTLHEEIASILQAHGDGWMTTQEISRQVVQRGLYLKRDGTSDVSAFQVHGRTKNYTHLFERRGSSVRLIGS